MRLAIVGIRGLPNSYGGFETLSEYLVENLAGDLDITVYCSSRDMPQKLKTFKGSTLRYIPVTSHGSWGILYDSLSLFSAVFKHDKVLILGFGGGFVMPLLKRYKSKFLVNMGGLDWKRNKWSPFAQKVIRHAERLLVKNGGQLISDNEGIQTYLMNEYGKSSQLIAYGGDQAERVPLTDDSIKEYSFLSGKFAFIVTRIQPDNNIEMMLDAFASQTTMPLVMVGNWSNSAYGKSVKTKYSDNKNLVLLEAIYDRHKLDMLRSNCTIYVHGHSAGGTNPSLVEAMYLGLPVFSYASGYNEFTTQNEAMYFSTGDELSKLIEKYEQYDLESMGRKMKKIAEENYRWKKIAEQYKAAITKA